MILTLHEFLDQLLFLFPVPSNEVTNEWYYNKDVQEFGYGDVYNKTTQKVSFLITEVPIQERVSFETKDIVRDHPIHVYPLADEIMTYLTQKQDPHSIEYPPMYYGIGERELIYSSMWVNNIQRKLVVGKADDPKVLAQIPNGLHLLILNEIPLDIKLAFHGSFSLDLTYESKLNPNGFMLVKQNYPYLTVPEEPMIRWNGTIYNVLHKGELAK